jgi:diguanylate cyclase (GGDEF)-like protein
MSVWRLINGSLRARIVAVFLGLLLVVQLAGFGAIRASLSHHALNELPQRLSEGDRVLRRLLEQQAQKLSDGARLLASDYGFREAIHTSDTNTIVSVLENHGERIGATQVSLYSSDLSLQASSGEPIYGLEPMARRLWAAASESSGPADAPVSEIALLRGEPYQFVMAPVRAPVVVGWVLMGFPIQAQLTADMQSLAAAQLTLLTRSDPSQPWSVKLSSLPSRQAAELATQPWDAASMQPKLTPVSVAGEQLGTHVQWLSGAPGSGGEVLALTSLSVDEATQLPHDLQWGLLAITLLSCAAFAVGSAYTAHRVTEPLQRLAAAADRLGAGDYATPMGGEARHDEIGQLSNAFERMRVSVSSQKDQIVKLAYWDALTGLPNRAQFRDALREALVAARGDGPTGASVAVLMLDLERFKHINEVLGYRFGDLTLAAVAERLSQHAMPDANLIARLGGDKFAILLRSGDGELAHTVAEQVADAFSTPLKLEEHTIDMGAAIGIACWPQHASDADGLLSRAEIAMYVAKQRNAGVLLYDPTLEASSAQTLSLLTDLRHAITDGQLRLYLQPKLSLDTAAVVGAEALVRWEHPQRGLVPPLQFIPFAEKTGFIRVLTLWVFEEAARHWRMLRGEGQHITLSVNLSTRDLLDPELPEKFKALLLKHEVPAEAFCLEITESAIMDDPQRAQATLERLSALGFALSIDDFGTGYSSLAYLKKLPVDELKIDQSFVKHMETDADDAKIVRSTIELAHNLGLSVVAEGVENEAVWHMLRELKCDQAQGYHMGRPMPADSFSRWVVGWLERHRPIDDTASAQRL